MLPVQTVGLLFYLPFLFNSNADCFHMLWMKWMELGQNGRYLIIWYSREALWGIPTTLMQCPFGCKCHPAAPHPFSPTFVRPPTRDVARGWPGAQNAHTHKSVDSLLLSPEFPRCKQLLVVPVCAALPESVRVGKLLDSRIEKYCSQ